MISDLEGMLVEQAEAQSSILQDLSECNKIQSNSIQTLVSCPRPPHHPLPRPSNSHLNCGTLQKEICKDMDAYNEAINDGFTSLERLVLELHTPTAPAPSSHVTPSFPSSAEGV